MIQPGKRYPGPAGMFVLSLCCHLALFSLIVWGQFLPEFQQKEEPVTYVDMVTLPVAAPQSGTPASEPSPAPVAPSPPPPRPAAMALPAPKTRLPAKAQAPKPKNEQPPAEDARQFSERIEKLKRLAEDKRQA